MPTDLWTCCALGCTQEVFGDWNPDVLLDAFHLIQRLQLSSGGLQHPGYGAFCADVRDALFQVVQEDRDREVDALVRAGRLTVEQARFIPQSYFVSKCRRTVRPPDESLPLLWKVLDQHSTIKFMIPGNRNKGTEDRELSVVTDRTRRCMAAQEEHFKNGCIRDPEGVPMYLEIKDAKDPSKVRHCTARAVVQPEACGLIGDGTWRVLAGDLQEQAGLQQS